MTVLSPITKDMRVLDIVTLCPEAEGVMAEYGLHCFHCNANAYETLSDGCATHGFEVEEIDELVDDINQIIRDLPEKPQTLILTAPAAFAIADIAKAEGKEGEGLEVTVDGRGGFCMEFRADQTEADTIISNAEVLTVKLFVSLLTLRRIGGSTIDFRDGRFKLDLVEEGKTHAGCACASGGECGCG